MTPTTNLKIQPSHYRVLYCITYYEQHTKIDEAFHESLADLYSELYACITTARSRHCLMTMNLRINELENQTPRIVNSQGELTVTQPRPCVLDNDSNTGSPATKTFRMPWDPW